MDWSLSAFATARSAIRVIWLRAWVSARLTSWGRRAVDQEQRKADPQSRRQKPLAPFAAPTTRPFGSAKPKPVPQLSRHSLHPLRAEYAKRGLS